MNYDKLIERLKCPQIHSCPMDGEYPSCKACQKSIQQEAVTAIKTLRAELEQEHAHRIHAEQHADAFLKDCERLNAELERVTAERDTIEQNFREFTSQWWEEANGFPCRFCKFENSGGCEWKAKHPDDERSCVGRWFEWRGIQKED